MYTVAAERPSQLASRCATYGLNATGKLHHQIQ